MTSNNSSIIIPSSINIYIEEIAQRLSNGKAAIMVGSGFSKNAKMISSRLVSFPDWRELGSILFEKLTGQKPGDNDRYLNPLKLAGEFEAAFGRAALDQLIIASIPDEQCDYSELHLELLELPWTDVFTTNYDTLLERAALHVNSQKYRLITTKEDLIYSSSPRIIKLHGSFPSQRPFIVTEEDYRQYPQNSSFFVNTVQQSLIENVLCLIGFSGDDPNFLNWIGWIRDNLGKKYSPKIFLIGLHKDILESQRVLLEQRNIVPIDLAQFPDAVNHETAYRVFFNCIHEKVHINPPLQWGHYLNFLPESHNVAYDVKTESILNEWKMLRHNFPGWVILPDAQRTYLWTNTQHWLRHYNSEQFDNLSPEIQFDFTYEIIWRLEKCLLPLLGEILVSRCESIVYGEKCIVNEFSKWFDVSMALLREYRIENEAEKWNTLFQKLETYKERVSEEQIAKMYYEKALFALFALDIPCLKQILDSWPDCDSLPLWQSKKAALFAELGDIDTAKKLLDRAYAMIRHHINLLTDKIDKFDYSLLAQEGCIIAIMVAVDRAKSAIEFRYFTENKFESRRSYLKQYQCDVIDDAKILVEIKGDFQFRETVKTIPGFDIGKTSESYWLDGYEENILLGYSCMMFFEISSLPLSLVNVKFNSDSISGAIKRIAHTTFYWAFVTTIRSNDEKNIDLIFNRELLASLSIEQIDGLISLGMESLKKAQSSIDEIPLQSMKKNLACVFAKMLPEILSRLCTKCSYDSLEKLLSFVQYLYQLPIKSHFVGVHKLVSRLIEVWPSQFKTVLFETLWKSSSFQPKNHLEDHEFNNPILLLLLTHASYFATSDSVNNEVIEFALKQMDSDNAENRSLGLAMLANLFFASKLDTKYNAVFKKKLWEHIDPCSGFPKQGTKIHLNKAAFLRLPYPSKIQWHCR